VYVLCSKAIPIDSKKWVSTMFSEYHCTQVDINVIDSDSELCFGQSFGVSDEGYNSMVQFETVEQNWQFYKDGKNTWMM